MTAEGQPRKPRSSGAAMIYATQYGWRVPLHPRTMPDVLLRQRGVRRSGQAPAHHAVPDASVESSQIRAWWERWPDANVGIATGAGPAVIDIDPRSGGMTPSWTCADRTARS